jgi:hypothetical protein
MSEGAEDCFTSDARPKALAYYTDFWLFGLPSREEYSWELEDKKNWTIINLDSGQPTAKGREWKVNPPRKNW